MKEVGTALELERPGNGNADWREQQGEVDQVASVCWREVVERIRCGERIEPVKLALPGSGVNSLERSVTELFRESEAA